MRQRCPNCAATVTLPSDPPTTVECPKCREPFTPLLLDEFDDAPDDPPAGRKWPAVIALALPLVVGGIVVAVFAGGSKPVAEAPPAVVEPAVTVAQKLAQPPPPGPGPGEADATLAAEALGARVGTGPGGAAESVRLWSGFGTDGVLAALAPCKRLRWIYLRDADVTEKGLAAFPELYGLELTNCKNLSDAALGSLPSLPTTAVSSGARKTTSPHAHTRAPEEGSRNPSSARLLHDGVQEVQEPAAGECDRGDNVTAGAARGDRVVHGGPRVRREGGDG